MRYFIAADIDSTYYNAAIFKFADNAVVTIGKLVFSGEGAPGKIGELGSVKADAIGLIFYD